MNVADSSDAVMRLKERIQLLSSEVALLNEMLVNTTEREQRCRDLSHFIHEQLWDGSMAMWIKSLWRWVSEILQLARVEGGAPALQDAANDTLRIVRQSTSAIMEYGKSWLYNREPYFTEEKSPAAVVVWMFSALALIFVFWLVRYSCRAWAIRVSLSWNVRRTEKRLVFQYPYLILQQADLRRQQTKRYFKGSLEIFAALFLFAFYTMGALSTSGLLGLALRWWQGGSNTTGSWDDATIEVWRSVASIPAFVFGDSLMDKLIFQYILAVIGLPVYLAVMKLLLWASNDFSEGDQRNRDTKLTLLRGRQAIPAIGAIPDVPILPAIAQHS